LAVLLAGAGTFLAHGQEEEVPFVLNGTAEDGKAVYTTYCAACHGDSGKGDGVAAAALDPKPADYTDAARMAKLTDEDLYLVVKEGGAAQGKSALMVAWKASLTDQQIRDVVAYVRSFAAKKE
jgi:mono/diheme cytochrome c family protein